MYDYLIAITRLLSLSLARAPQDGRDSSFVDAAADKFFTSCIMQHRVKYVPRPKASAMLEC